MTPLFTFLHLSDIHFAHGDAGQRADQQLVMERLLGDLRGRHARGEPAPDAIFITGDIAFSGGAAPRERDLDEYAGAARWLSQVAAAVGLAPEHIYVIPGNHDIQRTRAEGDVDTWRLLTSLRGGAEGLDDALRRANDRAKLHGRLANFHAFTAAFAVSAREQLFWCCHLPARDGLTVRLVGLNTALLANDNEDAGRLRLGKEQLREALTERGEHELVIVMGHHPLAGAWLADEEESLAWIQSQADLYLSGHIHRARSETRRLAGQGSFIPLSAGAVHGEPLASGVAETHRYHLAAVIDDGSGLKLRVWPRRFSHQQKGFVLDTDGVDRDQGHAEHPLRVAPATARPSRQTQPGVISEGAVDPSLPGRLRRLVESAHEGEMADALSALMNGEDVAFQVPAGFGASRAVKRAAQLIQEAGVVVHYIPPRILFPDLNSYLDDIQRELARKAPLPGRFEDEKRDLRLFRELREAARALHQKRQRLVVCIDDVERFRPEHQGWLSELLGVFAHLEDYAVSDPALRAVRVLVAGGDWLQKHLVGRVKATPLSPFNKARRIFLDALSLAADFEDSEVRAVVDAVGGHPDLLLWAADHGGQTDGTPAAEEGLFREQVERFREEPYRSQVAALLRGDEAAWRDPDPALRWSGWIKQNRSDRGWLGPALERLARQVVA